MTRPEAYARFLTALEESPLFGWGQPLGLWAVVSEDPYIITPIIVGHPGMNLQALEKVASQWPVEATVRVPGLMVMAEHAELHERTVVVTHQDAETVVVQKRSGAEPVIIDDAFTSSSDLVTGARVVGAAAWR